MVTQEVTIKRVSDAAFAYKSENSVVEAVRLSGGQNTAFSMAYL